MNCGELDLITSVNISHMHETLVNSKVSMNIHDQGKSFFCWAFAISTMLRQSLKLFISKLGSKNLFVNEFSKIEARSKLERNEFHKRLRNELIMLPIPKIKQQCGPEQAHVLDLAFQRVSQQVKRNEFYFGLHI